MSASTSRRAFLAGVAALATGCSRLSAQPGSVPTSAPAAPHGALRFQLGWVRNAQFAGTFLADRAGYFLDEGFESVTLLAGGPTVDPHDAVVDGRALLASTSAALFGAAVGAGAPLRVVAAAYRRNPYVVAWREEAVEIREVDDLAARTVAVPPELVPLWELATEAAGLVGDRRPAVVAPSGSAQELYTGEADALVAIGFGLPSELRVRGELVGEIGLEDMGVRGLDHLYVATDASITGDPERLAAALRAERRGWSSVLARPAEGVRLTTELYGADLGLDPVIVAEQLRHIRALMESGAGGLLSLDGDRVEATVETLRRLGHEITSDAFALGVLDPGG